MARAVCAVGASHTTLMNTRWAEVDHLDRAHAFRDGLAEAKAELTVAAPDLVIIVGSNHFRGFWLDLMPSFTIGVDEVIAAGEHGTPSGPQSVDPVAAQQVHQELLDRDFDIAFSTNLQVDHGISHAIQYLVPDGVPVVPVVINTFGPPLPSLRRCLALGDAIAEAIDALPANRRVAVIGTGGLSHRIPFPDWRSPQGADEVFLAESFRQGRGRWEDFEERRRPIVVGARPQLNTEFDQAFLADLAAGELSSFADDYSDASLAEAAGNGGNEVRAWLVMAAAMRHATGRTIAYSPMPEWLTGMGVAILAGPQASAEQAATDSTIRNSN